MDELEEFSREFKKRLDDAGAEKVIPEDLALEVKKSLSPVNQLSLGSVLLQNFVSVFFFFSV
jgi:hypothetical protein